MGSNPLTILRDHGVMSVKIQPTRALLAAYDAQAQRDERPLLRRIVILENYYDFQRKQPLRFSIRYEQTSVGTITLTRYC